MANRHEVVVKTENYLSSLGKNNSLGKYDKVVFGVRDLLGTGFLTGAELDKAIKREADRLLKKYNLDSRSVYDKAIRNMDADYEKVYFDGELKLSGGGSASIKSDNVLMKKGYTEKELEQAIKKKGYKSYMLPSMSRYKKI